MQRSPWTLLMACLWLAGSVHANPLAQFRTVFGTIEVELLRDQRPETVANFVRYVESGRYLDTFVHRIYPDFLVAAGGYRGNFRGTPDANYAAVVPFKPIVNETQLGGVITNLFGTLALGQVSNQSNRLTSEFFFSLSDSSGSFFAQNQGGYPVFGRIRRGVEVLQKLNQFKPLRTVQVGATNVLISILDPDLPSYLYGTSQFPVLIFNPNFEFQQQLETLVYIDITLLNVAVTAAPTGVQIAWDSVAGRPNIVEFTRSFPPVWESLSRVTGTGSRLTITDPTSETHRFHRVRVEY